MSSFRHLHKKPGGDKVNKKVKGSPSGPWSKFSNPQLVIAGGSLLGLGCLSYYGSNMAGLDSRVTMGLAWPSHVRQRLRDTYFYFGSSLVITTVAAMAVLRTPLIMGLARSNRTHMFLGGIVSLTLLNNVLSSQPYTPGTVGTNHLAWLSICSVVAVMVAPMSAHGGPLLLRAALHTGAMLGGLAAVTFCAPSDKFLWLGGPLAMGFGVMICASLMPGTSSMAFSHIMRTYGGLALFGGFLLYSNSRLVHSAEQHPTHPGAPPFDPIKASIGLFIHTVNAFAVMCMMMLYFET